jgi:hypothetical protein
MKGHQVVSDNDFGDFFHWTELSVSDLMFLQVYSLKGLVYSIVPRWSTGGPQGVSDNDFGDFFFL